MTSPQEYLSYVDDSGLTVRERISKAIYSVIHKLDLPINFDRQELANEMAESALDVFANSDDHGLQAPRE